MTLGVIADIHGNHAALGVVLEEFRRRGVCQVAFLGDLVGYYAFVYECLAMLAAFDVMAVRGNHDQVALDCFEAGHRDDRYRRAYGTALDRGLASAGPMVVRFLQASPPKRTIRLRGRTLLLCHGSPWDPLEGRVYPDSEDWDRFCSLGVDVVLMGHTHYPLSRRCGSVCVINPGSVGQARHRSSVASAALLDVGTLACQLLDIPYSPDIIVDDATAHDPGLPYLTDVLRR